MICPYCGEPMEKGFMVTHVTREILWIPETSKCAPSVFYTKEEIEEKYQGFILAKGGRIIKKQHPWKNLVTAAPMYVCRACKKGITCLNNTDEI